MLDGVGKYLQSLFPLCVLALIESEVDDRICANSQTSAFRVFCGRGISSGININNNIISNFHLFIHSLHHHRHHRHYYKHMYYKMYEYIRTHTHR